MSFIGSKGKVAEVFFVGEINEYFFDINQDFYKINIQQ